ncbi:siderophore ferric iron reductase, family [Pseudomonas sp. 37 R 15]|uniref:siderophore ferric iron reductase n=1 Tax=Pseudomonas sp. 37 R 15 TaxID=1844104 RepID=UPI000812B7D1|nr:siderophore ferric iron reductase [Pseudomonas sp. 37 R 15]CRM39463.1 siderophore ferric iron reductase, family [Pseudomonas sp. 37 R 15]
MCQATTDLARLINTATKALPRMAGRVGEARSGELVDGCASNPSRIAALHAHWVSAHPEAGPHYWAIHSWSLVIWQPIYLSLLAVHLSHQVPSLAKMGQTVSEGQVGGFCLPPHWPRQGRQADLIGFAAEQLCQFVDRQLSDFNSVCQIYPKMARLLAADCARAALLWVDRCQPMGNAQVRDLEGQWMEALALSPGSSLIEVQTDDGRQCLALGRKVCCQHFRRADGELCSTCPKYKQEERCQRLREEFTLQC